MDKIRSYFRQPLLQHILFWIGVLLYFILSSSMVAQMGYRQVIETYASIVLLQMIAAYTILNFLMPVYLEKGRIGVFVILLLLLLIGLFSLYCAVRMNYLEPRYSSYYDRIMLEYIKLSYWERLIDFPVVLSKFILYLSPTALLLLMRFYRNQQKYLQLQEQKKTAELSALKNQLNPHFLFNTLNNLYALAIKKSDKTPEVISKLSDILDYMLYRCNDKYVSLQKEIELIENYIALEKIRYGKRVKVDFNTSVNEAQKIAPLLLLTFVENAFKHGVSQEMNQAKIDIKLSATDQAINFDIENTTPKTTHQNEAPTDAIGLKNVKKQLELIYPKAHQLTISEVDKHYKVQLKIETR